MKIRILISLLAVLCGLNLYGAEKQKYFKAEIGPGREIKHMEALNCTFAEVAELLATLLGIQVEIENAPKGLINLSIETSTFKDAFNELLASRGYYVKEIAPGKFRMSKKN